MQMHAKTNLQSREGKGNSSASQERNAWYSTSLVRNRIAAVRLENGEGQQTRVCSPPHHHHVIDSQYSHPVFDARDLPNFVMTLKVYMVDWVRWGTSCEDSRTSDGMAPEAAARYPKTEGVWSGLGGDGEGNYGDGLTMAREQENSLVFKALGN